MTTATLGFCPDLRDAQAQTTPLLLVSLVEDSLSLEWLVDPKEVGTDPITLAILDSLPQTLSSILDDVGSARFFPAIRDIVRFSSLRILASD